MSSWEIQGFNPRTRTGCDIYLYTLTPLSAQFQSTHPHGVRLKYSRMARDSKLCFNPRTRTGCDSVSSWIFSHNFQFQSTHPHGVRLDFSIDLCATKEFQSTHPHGVRPPILILKSPFFMRFQSTHPHGVRR